MLQKKMIWAPTMPQNWYELKKSATQKDNQKNDPQTAPKKWHCGFTSHFTVLGTWMRFGSLFWANFEPFLDPNSTIFGSPFSTTWKSSFSNGDFWHPKLDPKKLDYKNASKMLRPYENLSTTAICMLKRWV